MKKNIVNVCKYYELQNIKDNSWEDTTFSSSIEEAIETFKSMPERKGSFYVYCIDNLDEKKLITI